MKKKPLYTSLGAGLISLGLAGSADAQLLSRLGGLAYYDDVAQITWLADANSGAGSSFDNGVLTTDGRMTWQSANDWAASLNIAGVTGWRLPDTLQPDPSCDSQSGGVSSSFNCTGSEMGNLFYNVLGGTANTSIVTTSNANYNLFSNIQTNYWSGTENATNSDRAWGFDIDLGRQSGLNIKSGNLSAWAVKSGDVSAVPVPAAVWLFGSGLLSLIGIARRKKA